MKMTTEKFLSALGIEVGKPFVCEGKKYKVVLNDRKCYELHIFREDVYEYRWFGQFDYLLDKEITPLPKYTLTEEEKVIVKSISGFGEMLFVCREISGHLCLMNIGEKIKVLLNDDLFGCIKIGNKVSLDELRKCL